MQSGAAEPLTIKWQLWAHSSRWQSDFERLLCLGGLKDL